MNKLFSLGQAIKNIRNNKISSSYFLYGNDIFMQDFFIEEFKKKININSYLYYLGYDQEENFFNEISNLSLFDSKKLIIIKNISRLTVKSKKKLLEYLSDSKSDNYLILVKNNFDSRNKFVDSLIKESTPIDVRTPFESKMKEWVNYIIKKEKITIQDNKIIEDYIDAYGDNISNVINYIKIDFLSNNNSINIYNRNYYLWHFQDSIGKKDLNKSIDIFSSLLLNGNSINLMIIYLFSLFEGIYEFLKNKKNSHNNFFVNKIIKNRFNIYSRNYSINEIEHIILKLKELDFLSKNSSININNSALCLSTNICSGYYE